MSWFLPMLAFALLGAIVVGGVAQLITYARKGVADRRDAAPSPRAVFRSFHSQGNSQ